MIQWRLRWDLSFSKTFNFSTSVSRYILFLIGLSIISSCSDTTGPKIGKNFTLDERLTLENGKNRFTSNFIRLGISEVIVKKKKWNYKFAFFKA